MNKYVFTWYYYVTNFVGSPTLRETFILSSCHVCNAILCLLVMPPLFATHSSSNSFVLTKFEWSPIHRGKNPDPAEIRNRVTWCRDEYAPTRQH